MRNRKFYFQDFPVGPVFKTLRLHGKGCRFDLVWELRSHMSQGAAPSSPKLWQDNRNKMIFLKKEFYFLCHCLGKSQSLYLGCNPNGTQIGSTPGSPFQGVPESIPSKGHHGSAGRARVQVRTLTSSSSDSLHLRLGVISVASVTKGRSRGSQASPTWEP